MYKVAGSYRILDDLRMHIGLMPDQSPTPSQILTDGPFSAKPSLHEYVAIEPRVTPSRVTTPFKGFTSLAHWIAAYERTNIYKCTWPNYKIVTVWEKIYSKHVPWIQVLPHLNFNIKKTILYTLFIQIIKIHCELTSTSWFSRWPFTIGFTLPHSCT